ncbi:methyltransferase domain-containing protein [Kitasatospora sp. NPDC096140]|uniref:class I SAM-dependent methyltransferase n=1 Tax=Kitasatospora sp. NPDC096140 TaxID=3155425 RepID=UPI00332216AF
MAPATETAAPAEAGTPSPTPTPTPTPTEHASPTGSTPPTVDPDRLEAAVGHVFGELGVNCTAPLIVLGDRLGLFRTMAGAGPLTSAELAARTGLVERYVREWLRGVAVAGYLDHDPATDGFTLTDEYAAVLADDGSPTALIGVFPGLIALWADLDRVEGFFRTGGGMGWGEHHPALGLAQERFTRPAYVHGLIAAWIPAVEGIVPRLDAGARVADVGCGHGLSSILIAQRWPRSTVVGFDPDDAAVARARASAAEAGLDGRAVFEVADAAGYPGDGYDLITFTDSLHDMGDPVAAVAHARAALAADGAVLVVEPLAADRFADDFANPYARVGYAISTLVCTPSSLAQTGAAALGTMAGEARLREVLAAGGLTRVRRIAEDSAPLNILLEARP